MAKQTIEMESDAISNLSALIDEDCANAGERS